MNTSIQTRVPRGVEARELTPAEVRKFHREHFPGSFLATTPACAGPCDQGRKLCPCPEACALIDYEDAQRGEPLSWSQFWADTPVGLRVGAVIGIAVLLALGITHLLAR